ncbi:hypothetical protein KPL35_15915 [Clostridium sp. CF011]|uniref:LPD25 domain-containing protein n=1 Tax=Clostridium sp. CF011 TaxID=2843318 RepID=UPI001C0C490B|nr:LPD25 domain-containing protein [Clostridium sp. CF011]MBU3093545.1 hypothetical protein [Clostridium sp. CF011]WAG71719.1 ssDNA-binding domain-containing protein [Clostridium sp. CF011]
MKTLEEKKEEIKNTMDMLEKGVKDVFESNKFKEYLNTMSKFHNYSVKNILWSQMQNPNAKRIAGMKTWNSLGRKITKGEKALRILAPYKHKKEIEMDKFNPKTNTAYVDKSGNTVREKQRVEWISFKAVPVFDISQTNGKELPTLVNELEGTVDNYENMKSSLVEVAKIPVEFENIENGSKGYYHLGENGIAIKEGMSEEQTIKTLIHETTHSRLHSVYKQKDINDIERNTKEIEAENTAFVVAKHFGIDTDDYSFGYVASWSKEKNLKELEASLKTIQKESNSLIGEIEEKLEDKLSKEKLLEKDLSKINLSDENIKEYEFFKTTKEVNLEDGTHIKKGTSFKEEGFENNKHTLHFCDKSENKYTNETAEYEFLLSELKEFSVPNERKQQFYEEDERIISDKAPSVEIVFSEVEDKKYFSEGEKISFDEANKRFGKAEKEVRQKKETAKENKGYYPYLKTKIILNIDNKTQKTMRYDIGDNYAKDLKEFCEKQLDKESLKVLKKNCLKIKNEKECELER